MNSGGFKNIFYDYKTNKIHLTEVWNGKSVRLVEDFKFSYYVEDNTGQSDIHDVYGKSVKPQVSETREDMQSLKKSGFYLCESDIAPDIKFLQERYAGVKMDSDIDNKLDFDNTLAFKDFILVKNPNQYEFSSIDATQKRRIDHSIDFFTLFDFSAKWDPIPTMLCQNHEQVIKGFMGQTTAFKKKHIKSDVLIMGETQAAKEARYIHGKIGNGTWTFYGGHDPEDYQHKVGDPKTDLSLHPNSPGYRLILNNILFPAAKKKKLKT